jgi:D-3-phosphoglycerate dehydrogenase
MPRLAHVVRPGSGLDGIDTAELDRRGIRLHRSPVASAGAVAQWCLAAFLALARRIALGAWGLAAGQHLKHQCVARPTDEMNVAVWGAGPVGRACADVLAPWVRDVAFAARPALPGGLPHRAAVTLPGWADAHVVAVPATPENHHRFGADFLRQSAGRAPLLIVVGRLATVDLPACLSALANGTLSGLGVDPVDPGDLPLPAPPGTPVNLLATPHIGAQRTDVRARLDAWVTRTARDALSTVEVPS